MTCVTRKAGNRHTTRHHRRESPAPESARQNRYTNPLHTASAGRSHAFTCTVLLGWYREGVDVEAHLPLLSTYLGHGNPSSTYWYVEAVPELLALAAERRDRARGARP